MQFVPGAWHSAGVLFHMLNICSMTRSLRKTWLHGPDAKLDCSFVWMQGKRIQDVAHRMHVALPAPRDGVARPPVIPPGVAAARARRDAGEKKQTEKDLQVRDSAVLPWRIFPALHLCDIGQTKCSMPCGLF